MARALLIFTDLDGTLLAHHGYGFDAAKPALARAQAAGVPVIPATSKTAAEVRDLVQTLGLNTPAIVENGGGIWVPDTAEALLRAAIPSSTATTRTDIMRILDSVRDDLRESFIGFSAMPIEDVMANTGLARSAAENAKCRYYSEPGIWRGSEKDLSDFCDTVAEAGLQVLRGGRFIHVMGRTNKAEQMTRLASFYQTLWPDKELLTAALGDAPNDVKMLEAADFGFIIANPDGKPIPELAREATGHVVRVLESGPVAWNKAVCGLLDRLRL